MPRKNKTWIITFRDGTQETVTAHEKSNLSGYVLFETFEEGSRRVIWRKEFYEADLRSIEGNGNGGH